ncbi:MAG: 1-(5-phosphoribosyl)-5-[(5-phosphoribosylamino)methylideneamino]imidazole-4-carboxamide isomerase [Spirochaetia bacterium]|nr:1-(5-phosphoribosyl)-5-[(5-phosphoribosylamino)methylideneamino]imidazole-4-carboxamide isomerase [Spirochaetia bacterium]
MQIIPAIDLIDNKVVRLSQGDYKQKVIYSDNPVETAKIFAEHGFKRLHIVDLSGAKEGKIIHANLVAEIKKETGCIIETGGGIRSLDDVETLWKAGLNPDEDFIMIGSLPFKNKEEFNRILENYKKNILMTVDVWGTDVKISGWMEDTNMQVVPFLKEMKDLGINNFLITQIQKDGMLEGPDFQLYEEVLSKVADINVIASGGVSSTKDFERLSKIKGLSGAILGRAFYDNKISLDEL